MNTPWRPILACALALCAASCDFLHFRIGTEAIAPANSRLGINLAGPCDWNAELPFVDVFKMARTWVSQRPGAPWGSGPALDLDEHGWIKSLAPGCSADALMCTIERGHYPRGEYVCLYQGEGSIEFFGADVVSRRKGRIAFSPRSDADGFCLSITATDPEGKGDYIRDIHVVMPGFEASFRSDPFNPAFLALWKGMNTIRFMDWMLTNNSTQAEWADRPKLDDYVWTKNGIPVEIMVDLANRLGVNPWFCMPHLATDGYVSSFASLVSGSLAPGLKAYVEYSNEIWNFQFEQTHYCLDRGRSLALSSDDFQATLFYSSRRSVEIFALWEAAFGGHGRLVRVMASQAANTWVSDQKLSFEDAYRRCDALAIAPYFGLSVSDSSNPSVSQVAGWSEDKVLDFLSATSIPVAIRYMRTSKTTADAYGLQLIAYEGGQHAVGILGGENNARVTGLFTSANRSERMGDLYRSYLDAWMGSGGGLFAIFSSVGAWSKYGSWSLIEYLDDDTPKYRAVLRWNATHPR